MINNNGTDLPESLGESLVAFDPTQGIATVKTATIQNLSDPTVNKHSESNLLQMATDTQDITKPYRIVFRGELVHDKFDKME